MKKLITIDAPELLTTYKKELEQFFNIYDFTFPDKDEREDPQTICDRIRFLGRFPNTPETTILLAITGEKLMGGAIVEYYTDVRCFLLTYILVADEFRGQGISRLLIESGLKSLVESKKEVVNALFFESNIPWKTQNDSFDPWERYQVFSKLGAKWIDINYTQPSLGKGRQKVHNLHLFIFPSFTGLIDKIKSSVLISYLKIFYRELGIQEPDNDPDFMGMIKSIQVGSTKEYLLLKEIPKKEQDSFRFSEVSVAYHFAETVVNTFQKVKYQDMVRCPIIGSYEFDLLLFRYQRNPPFRSYALTASTELECAIKFPQITTYNSEGRFESLVSLREEIKICVKTICTFFNTGRRIWTVILSPVKGTSITQDDVIKLTALFCSSPEKNNIPSDTRFDFHQHKDLTFIEFTKLVASQTASAHNLLFGSEPENMALIGSGVVQIDSMDCISTNAKLQSWEEAIAILGSISKNGTGSPQKLLEQYNEKPEIKDVLNLMCGISLGIFDYTRMSFEEIIDTLCPILTGKDCIAFMNKGVMNSFSCMHPMYQKSASVIGINPYMLLSSTVLAFDDFESSEAEIELDDLLNPATSTPKLPKLIKKRKKLERTVNEELLLNVFHYPTERITLKFGLSHRGIEDRIQNIRNRLNELISLIKDQIEKENKINKTIVAILLSAISILSLEAVFSRIYTSITSNGGLIGLWQKEGGKWVIFIPLSLILFFTVAYFTIRDIRKRN